MVQRLEQDFRALCVQADAYVHKLQTFPGAYTSNPADFFIFFRHSPTRFAIECKEDRNGRFDTHRLTQLIKLKQFADYSPHHVGLILLCFWKGTKTKSTYFITPVNTWFDYCNNPNNPRTLKEEHVATISNPIQYDMIIQNIYKYV